MSSSSSMLLSPAICRRSSQRPSASRYGCSTDIERHWWCWCWCLWSCAWALAASWLEEFRNGVSSSIGKGKIIVEFFSAEMLLSVCRYRSCNADGLADMISEASLSAREDFISPSAAITLARASRAASASAAIALCSAVGSETSFLNCKESKMKIHLFNSTKLESMPALVMHLREVALNLSRIYTQIQNNLVSPINV